MFPIIFLASLKFYHAFDQASSSDLMMYTNADVLFFDDLAHAIVKTRAYTERAVLVGKRIDLSLEPLPLILVPSWQKVGRNDVCLPWKANAFGMQDIRKDALQRGRSHNRNGIDYFVYPRMDALRVHAAFEHSQP